MYNTVIWYINHHGLKWQGKCKECEIGESNFIALIPAIQVDAQGNYIYPSENKGIVLIPIHKVLQIRD
jgi:hypothetical protein